MATNEQAAPNAQHDADQKWALQRITSHRRLISLREDDADRFEMEILWQTGERTWEPELNIQQDAPTVLFKY